MSLNDLILFLSDHLEIFFIVLNVILIIIIAAEWKEYKALMRRKQLLSDLLGNS